MNSTENKKSDTEIDTKDCLYQSLQSTDCISNCWVWTVILLIIPILSSILWLLCFCVWLLLVAIFADSKIVDHYINFWLYGIFISIFIIVLMWILAPILACHVNPLKLYPIINWLRNLVSSCICSISNLIQNYAISRGAVIANSNV